MIEKSKGLKVVESEPAATGKKTGITTPSQHPFPVFALCPPVYVDNAIKNNIWMKGENQKIDKDKFMGQWYNLYNVLAANSLVYLITPVKGLQDQTYVNSFAYLPNVKPDTIVLSNFTAAGRSGEEDVAGSLFKDLGYTVVQCPYKFEGEPELKYIRDNIYIGGYGIRTDIKAHKWLTDTYGCKIISAKTTEKLYHLDCLVFPMSKEKVMVCTEAFSPETVKEIEKVAQVVPVALKDGDRGICNSLMVEQCVYNASSLQFMKKTDEDYEQERSKCEHLEKICRDLGFELLFFDLSECEKSGAQLSCFVSHLNMKY